MHACVRACVWQIHRQQEKRRALSTSTKNVFSRNRNIQARTLARPVVKQVGRHTSLQGRLADLQRNRACSIHAHHTHAQIQQKDQQALSCPCQWDRKGSLECMVLPSEAVSQQGIQLHPVHFQSFKRTGNVVFSSTTASIKVFLRVVGFSVDVDVVLT